MTWTTPDEIDWPLEQIQKSNGAYKTMPNKRVEAAVMITKIDSANPFIV